jgi:hypothetical protein
LKYNSEIYGKRGRNYSRVIKNSFGGANIPILETDKLLIRKYLEQAGLSRATLECPPKNS